MSSFEFNNIIISLKPETKDDPYYYDITYKNNFFENQIKKYNFLAQRSKFSDLECST